MTIIRDKNEFYDMVERERARADRMGHCFSLITFRLPAQAGGHEREALLGSIRDRVRLYDDIGCFDAGRISVLMPYAGYEQAQAIAEKICSFNWSGATALGCAVLTYPNHWFTPAADGPRAAMRAWAGANQQLMDMLGLPSRGLPAWKRCMDILGAAAGIALLSPLLCLVALFVKAVSPGPALFAQERVGFLGTTFRCFKFRTMHLDAPTASHASHLENLIASDAPMKKLDGADPRIIAAGRILRATGLDELPQLFNVLRGDMSLIGPRPCIAYEAGQFKLWQRRRFDVVPGITGLWQVNGKNRTTFTEMIRYDIRYGATRNFLMDCAILFKTVPAVIVQVMEQRKPV